MEHLAFHTNGGLMSFIILFLSLSIHSIFESTAIGLSLTTTKLTSITAIVLAHKVSAEYAIGNAMVSSIIKDLHILIICTVFSCYCVINVFQGMILQDTINPDNSIIQAMVASAFLCCKLLWQNLMRTKKT